MDVIYKYVLRHSTDKKKKKFLKIANNSRALFCFNYRGAEQTWQGLTVTTDNPTRLLRNIGVTKVLCNGQESVFHNCKLQNSKLKMYKNFK